MENITLFGFDLFAIVVALWKMIVAEALPGLSERWKRTILSLLVAGAVVIVGLQSQGIIFSAEAEPTVTLVLTAVTTFLVTMGYAPEVIGTVNAAIDLVRISAVSKFSEPGVMSASSEGQEFLIKRMLRYRLHK